MQIYDLMVNRIPNPVGYALSSPRFSYRVRDAKAKRPLAARIRVAYDADMRRVLYDSGRDETLNSLCHAPELALRPRTRYWWRVTVWADDGETGESETAFFETGKMGEAWEAGWITAEAEGNLNFRRTFTLPGAPGNARVYMTGLGLYELYVNGRKAGDELLAPGCNDYHSWIQVQTYDVGEYLRAGENRIEVMLGDGWYKGRIGFEGKSALYGDRQALLMEMRLGWPDGTETVLGTDESWEAGTGLVRFANIYDGETFDATLPLTYGLPVRACPPPNDARLTDRLSRPVRVTQRLAPASLLHTPAGETVIDLGQEITGYLEFVTDAPRGPALTLTYGEVLQEGNFYRDNLRSAQQTFRYKADGGHAVVRPHFTFFGFRYVKLEGFDRPNLADFTGCAIHTDLPVTAAFDCGNEKVNRFFQNVLWGQRDNFADVPTDCPQRDERLGWTGDAQVFSGTAMYQMDCAAFFDKYLYDMRMEQIKLNGSIPFVVPMITPGEGSCAWADAATIIPFNLYRFYGDRTQLERHYPLMRDWVERLHRTDEENGGRRLWETGFHFADWLALDTKDGTPFGGTDPYFVASVYYYYSVSLLARAAGILGREEDARRYGALRGEIFNAFQREYFTPAGRLAQTTQTAYVCALFMGLATREQAPVMARLLREEIKRAGNRLTTGFVGTAYACRALTQAGLTTLAYDLFLKEDYPGWLYEVGMGATTVWERWNSILPDGRISGTDMNSLNHYAYGAVMEWVYRDVAGLAPTADDPGFRTAVMRPRPDRRLGHAGLTLETPMGRYVSRWAFEGDTFVWHVEVPFGARAEATLPGIAPEAAAALFPALAPKPVQGEARVLLEAGTYDFAYPWSAPAED
jgi:alpha-L-rhamnosidase